QGVDDHRSIVEVGAGANKRGVVVAVFTRSLAYPINDFGFRNLPGNVEVAIQSVFGWDRLEQIVDRARAHALEHGFAISRRLGKITHREIESLNHLVIESFENRCTFPNDSILR